MSGGRIRDKHTLSRQIWCPFYREMSGLLSNGCKTDATFPEIPFKAFDDTFAEQ
jgi:hypothetical protein